MTVSLAPHSLSTGEVRTNGWGSQGRSLQPAVGLRLALYSLCARPQDGSGYIDENELDALLKDLYEKNKKVSSGQGLGRGAVEGMCAPLTSHTRPNPFFRLLFCLVPG